VREGRVWDGQVEDFAEGAPAFFYVEEVKTFGRSYTLYVFDMFFYAVFSFCLRVTDACPGSGLFGWFWGKRGHTWFQGCVVRSVDGASSIVRNRLVNLVLIFSFIHD
jgi:hypothetical protein